MDIPLKNLMNVSIQKDFVKETDLQMLAVSLQPIRHVSLFTQENTELKHETSLTTVFTGFKQMMCLF